MSVDGVFLHHGSPVENEKVQELFSRGVSIREDGRVILAVGPQWCYVAVEDTPYIILGVSAATEGVPTLRLNTGARERLDPSSLWISRTRNPLRQGEWRILPARFSRTAFHQLITDFYEVVEEQGNGHSRPLTAPCMSREGFGRMFLFWSVNWALFRRPCLAIASTHKAPDSFKRRERVWMDLIERFKNRAWLLRPPKRDS